MRQDIPVVTWSGEGGNECACHFSFNRIEDLIIIFNGSEITNAILTKSGTIKLPFTLQKSDRLVITDRRYGIELLSSYVALGDDIANRKVGAEVINQAYELIQGATDYFEQSKVTLAEITQQAVDTIAAKLKEISARDQAMIQTSGHIDQQLAKMPQIDQMLFRLEQAQQQADGKIAQLSNALKTAEDVISSITKERESLGIYIQVMESLIDRIKSGELKVPLIVEVK